MPQVSSAAPSTDSADCLTTDGRVVTIRRAQPADAAAVLALHDRSSDETRYARFFCIHRYLSPEDAQRFVTVDHRDREALVAVDHGEIVGLAGYEGNPEAASAEVAFLIDDAHQRHGIGSLLLEHLVALARSRGFHHLDALVLPSNHRMLGVFRKAGFDQIRSTEPGEITLRLGIDDAAQARPSIEAREHVADVASMQRILQPASVAFVTGPLETDQIGRGLADRCSSRFAGAVHVVNPDGLPVGTAHGYRSVDALPDEVDLAVISVAEPALAPTLAACGARNVAGCVVTTPVADRGSVLELRRVARAAGIRLIGPGSSGFVDRHRGIDVLIDAPSGTAGPIGLACQSGSIARALTDELDDRGVGVASVVTLGAKADVSGNDLLQVWSVDPDVRVVVLQLESLGNPRRFTRIVRAIGRTKPVVLLRTAQLHDLLLPDDRALLDQLGVIDVPSIEEAVEVAALLATEPLPRGRRVSVVSPHRGPGLLAVDRLRDEGLEVVEQVVGTGPSSTIETDSIFVVDAAPPAVPPDVAVAVAGHGQHSAGRMARALRRATVHASWMRRDLVPAPVPGPIDRAAARTELWFHRAPPSGWIDLAAAAAVIEAYGMRVARPHLVSTAADAAEAAAQIGYPVVLDGRAAHGDEPLRDLRSLAELAARWEHLVTRHGPAVLPMGVSAAGPLVVLRLHVTPHPQLGPVLRVVPRDGQRAPTRCLLPMDREVLDGLVDEVVGQPRSGADPEALRDLLLRVSALVLDNPELLEVHLDLVDVASRPASVVGVHLRTARAPGAWDDEVRHLRRDDIGVGR
jgi:succinyl-CoA synthetase alpha subunit/GNAT superfamily N-acetyltransferase